jgi:SAM-dependent methyltransferase
LILFGEEPSAATPQRTADDLKRRAAAVNPLRNAICFRGIPVAAARHQPMPELFRANLSVLLAAMARASEQHYRGESGQRYQREKRAVPERAYPWIARLRAEKFSSIGVDDVVVEFGAGLGWNLANLKCARRIAIDLEDFLPWDLKKSGVEFRESAAALAENFADAIICHHVLEHVEVPTEMLQHARRILKPNGRLFVNVPFEKEGRYRRYDAAEPNHHLYSWNAQSLGNLMTSQGFQIQEIGIGQFGYDRFAAKLALRFNGGEGGFRMIRRLAHLLRPGLEVRAVAAKAAQ